MGLPPPGQAPPPRLPRHDPPEQLGQAGGIVDARVAKGDQQPALARLEPLDRPKQGLRVRHHHLADAAVAQPEGQQEWGSGQDPAVELGRQERQGWGGWHGLGLGKGDWAGQAHGQASLKEGGYPIALVRARPELG